MRCSPGILARACSGLVAVFDCLVLLSFVSVDLQMPRAAPLNTCMRGALEPQLPVASAV